ncbi:TDT family transporter [Acinetobacter sp. BY484]|uniref:TDT family transporter n=1 Tax=Acinetobacter sp. BY484 TaxID=2820674 RepID=UPI001C24F76B|nr:TDT family transporter [Acinetobacter sp. BY484]
MKKPFADLNRVSDLIREFTPNWFTVTMGTGVVALIRAESPLASELFWQIGAGLWLLNIILFVAFLSLYALRWIYYPVEARQIFQHPNMSLFLGAIPMGLATIINGFLKFGIVQMGDIAVQIAGLLWYVDVALAVVIAWVVPFFMYSRQKHELKSMTAVWLLPIVACEVAASSGGLLLAHLEPTQQSVMILLGSYMLWGISVLPAFGILSVLMLRLALHQLPAKEMAISSWLALGPIGTGALALLLLGHQAPQVLAVIDQYSLGLFFQQVGIIGALILLGFGVWWFGIALLTTLYHAKKQLPFNLGWWGLTFPIGVFTLAVFNLAVALELQFLYAVAYALGCVLVMLWILVATKTAAGFYHGNLIFSPCLKQYLQEQQMAKATEK